MDALSIAASVVALTHVVNKLMQFTRSVKNAPQEVQATSVKASQFMEILRAADQIPKDSFIWALVQPQVVTASEVAEELRRLLQRCVEADGKFKRLSWMKRKYTLKQAQAEFERVVSFFGQASLAIIHSLRETQNLAGAVSMSVSLGNTLQEEILEKINQDQTLRVSYLELLKKMESSNDEVLKEFRNFREISESTFHLHPSISRHPSRQTPTTAPLFSPYTAFETSSNFFPEQYTVDSKLYNLEASYTPKTACGLRMGSIYKVCLIYAESPRTWRRLTLSFAQKPDHMGVSSIVRLLPVLDISYSDRVTNISNFRLDDIDGKMNQDLIQIREDPDEMKWDQSRLFAGELDDLGCEPFLESEVVPLSAINGHDYYSIVRGEKCIEKKLTFAMDGDDTFSSFYGGFFANVRSLHALRFSKGIVRLKGVVLDDHRRFVKSYLITDAELGTIGNVLRKCKASNLTIPWAVREEWAREIVAAVADVHSQNLVIGRHGLWSLVLDLSGHVRRKNVDGNMCLRNRGWVAPEARVAGAQMSAKTDLFQLGLELWLLARQDPGYGMDVSKICCREAGCSFSWSTPGERCPEAHSDPVRLPPCGDDVPSWYESMVEICRSDKPGGRLAARKLLELFPPSAPETALTWARGLSVWPGAENTRNRVAIANQGSWWRPRGLEWR